MAVQKVNFLFFAKMGNGGKGRKVQFPKAKQSSIMKFAKLFKLVPLLNSSKLPLKTLIKLPNVFCLHLEFCTSKKKSVKNTQKIGENPSPKCAAASASFYFAKMIISQLR